jgi:hypothetical protein
MRRLLLIAIAVKGKRLTLAADTYACALSPSALSGQNGMPISRWWMSRWAPIRGSCARTTRLPSTLTMGLPGKPMIAAPDTNHVRATPSPSQATGMPRIHRQC